MVITNNEHVSKVKGEVDIANANQFENAILNQLEKDYPYIVLDLTEMDYIDSTGIGILMDIKRNKLKEGQDIILYQPKRSILKLFQLTGIDQVFDIKK